MGSLTAQEKLIELIKNNESLDEITRKIDDLTGNGENPEALKFKDKTDLDEGSPLHIAIKSNRPDVVKLLLEKGPGDYICYKNGTGWNSLCEAAIHRRPEMIKSLLESTQDGVVLKSLVEGEDGKELAGYLKWREGKEAFIEGCQRKGIEISQEFLRIMNNEREPINFNRISGERILLISEALERMDGFIIDFGFGFDVEVPIDENIGFGVDGERFQIFQENMTTIINNLLARSVIFRTTLQNVDDEFVFGNNVNQVQQPSQDVQPPASPSNSTNTAFGSLLNRRNPDNRGFEL